MDTDDEEFLDVVGSEFDEELLADRLAKCSQNSVTRVEGKELAMDVDPMCPNIKIEMTSRDSGVLYCEQCNFSCPVIIDAGIERSTSEKPMDELDEFVALTNNVISPGRNARAGDELDEFFDVLGTSTPNPWPDDADDDDYDYARDDNDDGELR